jgi:polyisoprenoid-binding protein YceI
MKLRNRTKCLSLLGLMLLAGVSTVRGEPKTFEIDPVHSCVLFRIQHLYTMFTGRFTRFSGTISGDMKDPASLRVAAEVDILSVDTANKDRDTHLLSPDFFDSKQFAVARFASTRTTVGTNDTAQVVGNLTIRDVTREVTFTVKFLGYGPDTNKGKRAGFHAEAKINRKEFGIKYGGKTPDGRLTLGEDVELIFEVEAVEK